MKNVNINVRLSEELRDEFRRIADDKSQNTSALIRKWIADYVKEYKNN